MRRFAALFGSCSVAAALVIACVGGSGSPTNPLAGDASPVADGASPGSPGPVDAGPPDERILPLTVGHQWTFDVKPADGGTQPATCLGTQIQSVSGVGHDRDAGPTVLYHPLCSTLFGVEIAGNGDRLIAYVVNDAGVVQGQPLLFLDTPVEDGHQWVYSGGLSFVWHDAGTQTVPAGTFSQCWERAQVGETAPQSDSIIYCRGVGQVRLVNSTFQAELTSKNF
jgi:hypothetical protein